MKKLSVTAALCGVLLGGCAGVEVEHYRSAQPVLDLPRYFDGTIDGWGMFQSRSGDVVKRFHVVIDARWTKRDGQDVGTLDEHFTWFACSRARPSTGRSTEISTAMIPMTTRSSTSVKPRGR